MLDWAFYRHSGIHARSLPRSMLHEQVHAAWPNLCKGSLIMLYVQYVHVHDACPCPCSCCMSMSMLNMDMATNTNTNTDHGHWHRRWHARTLKWSWTRTLIRTILHWHGSDMYTGMDTYSYCTCISSWLDQIAPIPNYGDVLRTVAHRITFCRLPTPESLSFVCLFRLKET
jgi:hypothetical protein